MYDNLQDFSLNTSSPQLDIGDLSQLSITGGGGQLGHVKSIKGVPQFTHKLNTVGSKPALTPL